MEIDQLDSRGETKNGRGANFGGIEMAQRATLQSNVFNGTVGGKFYLENAIDRETTHHFWKGNRVYELTSPSGEIY